jgi:hypothetical protein
MGDALREGGLDGEPAAGIAALARIAELTALERTPLPPAMQ